MNGLVKIQVDRSIRSRSMNKVSTSRDRWLAMATMATMATMADGGGVAILRGTGQRPRRPEVATLTLPMYVLWAALGSETVTEQSQGNGRLPRQAAMADRKGPGINGARGRCSTPQVPAERGKCQADNCPTALLPCCASPPFVNIIFEASSLQAPGFRL